MSGRYLLVFLQLMIASLPGYTQVHINSESLGEELLYRDDYAEVPVEFFEEEMDLNNQPININTATPEQLGASRLFTPFQVHVLLKYRNEFGALYSVFELAGLSGFRMERLRELEPFLSVEMDQAPLMKPVGRHMVMFNTTRIYPDAAGYRNRELSTSGSAYIGLPVKSSFRIKTHVGQNISFGLALEKDAGEKFLNGFRPEFLSTNVTYRGNRIIKQLVLGDFQLQHGLGLTNGSGFINTPEGFQIHLRPIMKLKPYASLNEYRFERGIACLIDLRSFELMMWSSYQQPDLSLGALPENQEQINWLDYQRTTGLHRTEGELKGRSLAYRIHSGMQTTFRHENLSLGFMIGVETSGLTKRGIDSLKNNYPPFHHQSCSLHGQWHRNRLEVMGEIAVGDWKSTALQAGFRYYFSDFIHGLILVHRYGPSYKGIQPSSYASGNSITNEGGLALHMHAEPGVLFNADLLVELFRYSSPRHICNIPSTGYRYSLTFKNNRYNSLQWRLKLVKKVWQTTTRTNTTGLRTIQTPEVLRFDFRIIPSSESALLWQSRLVISMLSEHDKTRPGYAAVQQLSLNDNRHIKGSLQFVVFHVVDWGNRIYLYEPGLYYDFNFPVYYGSGQKISSVVTVKAGEKVTISFKASMLTYYDRNYSGSGNDMILGNKKWEARMQLRLNF